MAEKVEVKGLRELEKQLLKLKVKAGKKVLRKASMAAIKPITDQAKINALAVRDSGALALAMGRWARAGKQVGSQIVASRAAMTVFTGPKSKNKRAIAAWMSQHPGHKPINRIRHAHLAEFGGGTIKRGFFYMTRAFDQRKFATLPIFKRILAKSINEVRRR